MPSTVPLCVAIFDQGVMFKHWSLFIDTEAKEGRTMVQAMGSEGRFRFEKQVADPRDSASPFELLEIWDIDASQVDSVKEIAAAVPIRNDIPAWNCQDYVVDLLEALEKAEIVPGADSVYIERKMELVAKHDGLE